MALVCCNNVYCFIELIILQSHSNLITWCLAFVNITHNYPFSLISQHLFIPFCFCFQVHKFKSLQKKINSISIRGWPKFVDVFISWEYILKKKVKMQWSTPCNWFAWMLKWRICICNYQLYKGYLWQLDRKVHVWWLLTNK